MSKILAHCIPSVKHLPQLQSHHDYLQRPSLSLEYVAKKGGSLGLCVKEELHAREGETLQRDNFEGAAPLQALHYDDKLGSEGDASGPKPARRGRSGETGGLCIEELQPSGVKLQLLQKGVLGGGLGHYGY